MEDKTMNETERAWRVPPELMVKMGGQRRLEKYREQKEKTRRADFDELTGLPNRHTFELILENRLRAMSRENGHDKQTGVAVIFMDMTGFKRFNDAYGHPFGDLILQLFATSVSESVRETETVCRWGGDEFEILLEGLNEEHTRMIFENNRVNSPGIEGQINQTMREQIKRLCEEGKMEWDKIGKGVMLDDYQFFAHGMGFVSGQEYRESNLEPRSWIQKLNDVADQEMYSNKAVLNKKMGVNQRS